jgi:phytoene synthase
MDESARRRGEPTAHRRLADRHRRNGLPGCPRRFGHEHRGYPFAISTELYAAAITDSRLRRAYRHCRDLNARHGRTFFLATRLLAPAQRPAIHALYGFARWADDIVDLPDPGAGTPRVRLDDLTRQLLSGLDTPGRGEPVVAAVGHTVARYHLDNGLFRAFLDSMRMDLTVTGYPDRPAPGRSMCTDRPK